MPRPRAGGRIPSHPDLNAGPGACGQQPYLQLLGRHRCRLPAHPRRHLLHRPSMMVSRLLRGFRSATGTLPGSSVFTSTRSSLSSSPSQLARHTAGDSGHVQTGPGRDATVQRIQYRACADQPCLVVGGPNTGTVAGTGGGVGGAGVAGAGSMARAKGVGLVINGVQMVWTNPAM